jgi:AcrR family transcriptional regulator
MVRAVASTRDRIFEAATTLFARYGYKRTSMEDIAQEAGLSRAALYLQFRNKEEIFREGARMLHEESLANARLALAEDRRLADKLVRAVEAKTLRMLEIAHTSPHGEELTDQKNRLCGDLAIESERQFLFIITESFEQADRNGEIDLRAAELTANEAADVFANAVAGLKGGSDVSVGAFRRRLATMVRVYVAGLSAPSDWTARPK